jgi:hypothetical protein
MLDTLSRNKGFTPIIGICLISLLAVSCAFSQPLGATFSDEDQCQINAELPRESYTNNLPASVAWHIQTSNDRIGGDLGAILAGDIDSQDNSYITSGYCDILVFDPDGNLLRRIDHDISPNDIAIGPDNTIWLVDTYYEIIYHLTQTGEILAQIDGSEFLAEGFSRPSQIEVDQVGRIYVLGHYFNQSGQETGGIIIFDSEGNLIKLLDIVVKEQGAVGGFDPVIDFSVSADGTIYVIDVRAEQKGIQVYGGEDWELVENLAENVFTNNVRTLTSADDGSLYISSRIVYHLDPSGNITSYGVRHPDPPPNQLDIPFEVGQLDSPEALLITSNGDLIIADSTYGYSQVFRITLETP